ncbi:MAG: hypothetical protein JXB49_06065 [Bacteroidales bacterium]|nr:hypothetical protein [Bacteroidales bacterium]
MKNLILIFCILTTQVCIAQPPDVPNIDSLKTDEDYIYFEEKLLLCIEWLRMNPLDKDYELRIRTGAFIRYWTTTTPTLTLTINRKVAAPILQETEFRYTADVYMAYYTGMLEYQLNNPDEDNQYIIQSKGVENVLQLYYYNKELLKDCRAIQEFLRLSETNELKDWIRKKI